MTESRKIELRSPDFWEVIEKAFFGRWSYSKTAKILGCDTSTAKKCIGEFVSKLRLEKPEDLSVFIRRIEKEVAYCDRMSRKEMSTKRVTTKVIEEAVRFGDGSVEYVEKERVTITEPPPTSSWWYREKINLLRQLSRVHELGILNDNGEKGVLRIGGVPKPEITGGVADQIDGLLTQLIDVDVVKESTDDQPEG